MKGRQSQIVDEKNGERNVRCARGGEEEGARQHHARYLESSNVWEFFHSSLRLSASRRQHSTSRIFFQAPTFNPSLIGQNESASQQPLDDGVVRDGAVPVQSRRGWVQRESSSGLDQGQ